VLHIAPTDDHEQRADAFAAVLLMPPEDGHQRLGLPRSKAGASGRRLFRCSGAAASPVQFGVGSH
jgi:Zn-dependent peptidase ImmA (M78 family)